MVALVKTRDKGISDWIVVGMWGEMKGSEEMQHSEDEWVWDVRRGNTEAL